MKNGVFRTCISPSRNDELKDPNKEVVTQKNKPKTDRKELVPREPSVLPDTTKIFFPEKCAKWGRLLFLLVQPFFNSMLQDSEYLQYTSQRKRRTDNTSLHMPYTD